MKRATWEWGSVAKLILVIVVFFFLLSATGLFAKVIDEVAKKGGCDLSIVVSTLHIDKTLPEGCMKFKTLAIQDLAAGLSKAKNRIEEWKKEPEKYKEALREFKYDGKDDTILYEYALDEYMAKSMKSCWDLVYKGQLPLFPNTWDWFDWTLGNEIKGNPDVIEGPKIAGLYIAQIKGPPVFCIPCERIKFDDSIKRKFASKSGRITSLPVWMKNNAILPKSELTKDIKVYDNTAYAEYLEDDAHKGIFQRRDEFNVNEAQTILYARVNVYRYWGWANWAGNFVGLISNEEVDKPVNTIAVAPYGEIGEKCHVLIT